MRAPCGNCGTYVELGSALREGYEVVCPACGAVIVPGRPGGPARAEIPGLGRTEKVVPQACPAPSEKPGEPPAPSPAEMAGRNVERRVNEHEAMKRRRRQRELTRKVLDVAVLLGLLLVLWFICKAWNDYRQHQRALAAQERAAQDARDLTRERLKAEERQRIEERLAAEREASRLEKARQEAERLAKAEEVRRTEEAYRAFRCALRENEFDMFSAAVTSDFASVETELCYLLPIDNRRLTLYWVVTHTNASAQIVKIDPSGTREVQELDVFLNRIAALDYLVAREGKVYYHASRAKPLRGKLDWQKATDPATLFFGGLAKTLEALEPAYDELCFDLVFIPKDGDKRIFCGNLAFGCLSSPEAIRAAVAQAYPLSSAGVRGPRVEPFKRTVKFWNGSRIKQGSDGITYVPRKPPAASGAAMFTSTRAIDSKTSRQGEDDNRRYQALFARAQQEDRAEAAHDERLARQRATAAERAWREKIDRILREGQLYYHAKKSRSR